LKSDYHITREGLLKRQGNTVCFVSQEEKRYLPIEKVRSIYAYKPLTLSSGVVNLLCKMGVTVHFFGWYGNYEGTLWPKETLVSGEVILRQAEHCLNPVKRLELARAFVRGSILNLARNIGAYSGDLPELRQYVDAFHLEESKIKGYDSIPQLMSAEGHVRDAYYEALDLIFPDRFKISKRDRRPPSNWGNALMSFANGLVYATVVTEIYGTHLHPAISYLHEPFERRFSLALDVAEIFKPIIADRVILKLVNKNMLGDEHFEEAVGGMSLSDSGRRVLLESFRDRLAATIKHKGLGREVSYQRLIRLELYKLENHLIGSKQYRPLIMWW